MKNKGFTLIELLAVIVILAIILLIAVPQVLDVIEEVKNKAYISTNDLVVDAAELYMASHVDELPTDENLTVELSLTSLENYISEVKARDNNCSGYVLVTRQTEDKYFYDPYINCSGVVINNSIDDQLEAYWKMEGNLYDYSGNGHTLEVRSTPTLTTGYKGNAYEFDYALDGFAAQGLGYFDSTTDSEVTISAWIYSYDITLDQNIISRNPPYFFRIVNSKIRCFVFNDEGVWSGGYGNTVLESNTWYHLVMTYDSKEIKAYLNGELDYYKEFITGSFLYYASLYIGYPPNVGEQAPFYGKIDELRIYNRALSEEEVKELYLVTK